MSTLGLKAVNPDTGEVIRFRKPWMRMPFYTVIEGESMTQQSHAASCDINAIIRKFDRTGELPVGRVSGTFGDVTGLQGDLTEQINASRAVQSKVRGVIDERRKAEEAEAQADREAGRAARAASKAASASKDSSSASAKAGGPGDPSGSN